MEAERTAWAAADLRHVVELGLHHEGHLLSAGEAVVARALLDLPEEPVELYARLLSRKGPVFRVGALDYALDVRASVAALAAAGLVQTGPPDDACLPAVGVPTLKDACRRLGLPVGGSRPTLEERLKGRRWVDEPFVHVGHAGLVRRLERLCFQRAWMDRATLVIERLGNLRWATYEPTGGVGLHQDRRAMLRWEQAQRGEWAPGEARAWALRGPEPGGRLSAWRAAVETHLQSDVTIEDLERLRALGVRVGPALALALERAGRLREALDVCRAPADAEEALALARTGARLARRLGWTFLPPDLRAAPVRTVRLPRVDGQPRPRWVVDDTPLTVEAAAVALLRRAGRRALHAENTFWTTLFALVFREELFLPVPGMLPTSRREGPLDAGTPGFYTRRKPAVEARLRRLAEEGLAPAVEGWQGERLSGLGDIEEVRSVVDLLPEPVARCVLRRLLLEGWSAARGLPDLLVLPGPAARVPALLPPALPSTTFLAEIKGEGDTLREGQRVWHDHLLDSDVHVEIWSVRSA